MYNTTGLHPEQFENLVDRLRSEHPELLIEPRNRGGHHAVSFSRRVHIALCYLKLNFCEAALAEFFETSQPTVSRIITTFTPVVSQMLVEYVPTGDDLDPQEQLLVDGTLLPCWSWVDQPGLWSGKHQRTGVNVQVAVTHAGILVWVSDPLPGATHDANAIRTSAILEAPGPDADFPYIGDKGYVGLGMLTPTKKPAGGELTEEQKTNNKVVNRVRAVVERAIANLKTWRVLHSDYRRPFDTFTQTISAVLGLEFWRKSEDSL